MTERKKKTEGKIQKKMETKVEGTLKGKVGSRGRIFEGVVIRKFDKRVTISLEKMIYIKKYNKRR